ncbi:hypothetical protein C9383_13735 [Pseudomonas palleroniana]|uniref:Uncharacterized protein n=1 Tax=Pseudomonas palleroniana TaxID=191390 RepID=A0A2L1JBP6_9PSED|nr:hypothetical protein CYL20_15550 [Pseudomonas palleroniana]PTC27257.1 hypothetical protein C9383_13735 [Pseudomonas palleroniana]
MVLALLQGLKALARGLHGFFIGRFKPIVKHLLANFWRQWNAKKPCVPYRVACRAVPLVGFLAIGAMMVSTSLLLF